MKRPMKPFGRRIGGFAVLAEAGASSSSSATLSSPPMCSAATRRQLGDSDLMVSKVCLGTMTWGQQNTEGEAHEQLSWSLDHGINFLDTAEM